MAPVAAGHHDETANRAGLHRFNNFVCQCKHLIVRKAGDDLPVFQRRRRRTLFRKFNDCGEIFRTAVDTVRYMRHTRISRHAGRENPVAVRILNRRDAVGRHQNRPVEAGELLVLKMPRIPVVAVQMRILFKLRI